MLRRREFVRDLSKLPSAYFKNLYFDTSGSKSPASLAGALELTDAAHILFGSDFPANQDIPEAIACVRQASISEENKRGSCIMICWSGYDRRRQAKLKVPASAQVSSQEF